MLAGYFDSYLGENELFGGNWGVYPFTNNCNIYVSDRSNGLFVVDFPGCDTNLGSISDNSNPRSFQLHAAFPNPFNPITMLSYELPEITYATLTVYNILGKEIIQLVSETQGPGHISIAWNAKDRFGNPVGTGVYIFRLRTGNFMQTRKMVYLK